MCSVRNVAMSLMAKGDLETSPALISFAAVTLVF